MYIQRVLNLRKWFLNGQIYIFHQIKTIYMFSTRLEAYNVFNEIK
jgi:hypothetical protein